MAVFGAWHKVLTGFMYDSKNMKIVDQLYVDQFIKEPVREGWSYGENFGKRVNKV